MIKHCAVCGTTENLELVTDKILKTDGYDWPLKKGYICPKCKKDRLKDK